MDDTEKKKCTEEDKKEDKTEKPADKTDSKTTDKNDNKPADKSETKPADKTETKPTDKPADKTETKPADKTDPNPTDKPADTKDTSKPADKTDTSKPTDKTDSKPADKTDASKPAVKSVTSKPADKTDTSKPADKTDTSKPADKTDTSKPAEKIDTSKPADKTDTSKPADKTDASKPADKTDTSKPADKTDSKPVDKIDTSKPADKTDTSKPADKTDDKPLDKTAGDKTNTNKPSDKSDNSKPLDKTDTDKTAPKTDKTGVSPNDIKATLAEAEDDNRSEENRTDGIAARWIFAVLGCVGFMIVYGLKVNLSVAIIAMVNHTAVAHRAKKHGDGHGDGHGAGHDDHMTTPATITDDGSGNLTLVDECGRVATKENLLDGPFDWDDTIQGLILASYFYGYILTQVPGGWVAEKFSAKHVFGVGALINAICALITPVAAKGSPYALVFIRIVMGIAGGVTLPGMHVLVATWAPPAERSKIASTVYAGMTLGTLVCMPFSGILAASIDWTAIFYVQGGLSLIWYVLWMIFVFDSPAQHPRISRAERRYIEESLGTVEKSEKPSIPWKKVFTSMPVWAIIVAHTCSNWGWYMLLVKLPTYMRYILKFDIKSNAGLSAVPFLCMWIFTMLLANLLDELRSRKKITTTFARKTATLIASVPPSVCLIGVTYVGCNTDLAVALLTLGTMFIGGMYSGFLSNHIDIAPPFAGTLMGLSNTVATLPGIIVPSFVGFMTHGNQTVEAWRVIFFITLGIFLFEAVFYTIFGSGEEQEWAKKKPANSEGEAQKLNDMA